MRTDHALKMKTPGIFHRWPMTYKKLKRLKWPRLHSVEAAEHTAAALYEAIS